MINANLLNGKLLADEILNEIANESYILKTQYNFIPRLAIIAIGDNSASNLYINNKRYAASKVGIETELINLPASISQQQLLNEIYKLNDDLTVSSIIVQLPIPGSIDKNEILKCINPLKDVDGFHPINAGYNLLNQNSGFIPPTALGCYELIKATHANLNRLHVVIVGRSTIVGKPLAALLLNHDATITVCHSKTQNLKIFTKAADIVICAIGSPNFFTADYFKQGVIIIDVGINWQSGSNRLTGDVDQVTASKIASYISPVPGGVGPLTVAFLLKNTIKAAYMQNNFT